MAYSMTGFGRSEKLFDTRTYTVEIKSVNSRFCDINIRMPRLFNFADAVIRKMITDRLVRGKVDIYISFDDSEGASTEVVINEGLAKEYSSSVTRLAELTGRADDLTASRLSLYSDILSIKQKTLDEEVIAEELYSAVNGAIDEMLSMRLVEGNNLAKDMLTKIDTLASLRDEIATRAPGVVEDYRNRLKARLDEILTGDMRAFYDDARLTTEVTVFADKCAIDEELSRLISHFSQAREILTGNGPVGKRMDFLVQEINREVNTIGSKANDIEITNRVMLMKNEVEKVREQIQNLV
ncbi:MAG: YicC family protein [Clostridia bacterium]|nr:YicC family protein [Clostridia bacterium]